MFDPAIAAATVICERNERDARFARSFMWVQSSTCHSQTSNNRPSARGAEFKHVATQRFRLIQSNSLSFILKQRLRWCGRALRRCITDVTITHPSRHPSSSESFHNLDCFIIRTLILGDTGEWSLNGFSKLSWLLRRGKQCLNYCMHVFF